MNSVQDISAIEKLKLARARVMRENPFWGVQSLRLIPVEDPTTPTLWTDGISVGFNPQYVLDTELHFLKSDWARQVCHVVLEHPFRRGVRNQKSWTKACNYAANSLLYEAGFALPTKALYSDEYLNLSTEDTYSRIHEEEHEEKSPESDSSTANSAEPESDLGDSSDSDDSASSPSPQTYPGYGEVRDCPSEVSENAEFEGKESLQQALNNLQSQIGSLPGTLQEKFKIILYGKVNWQEVLNNFIVSCAGSENYTWSKPNNNYLHLGLYLPSLKANQTNGFVFYFDTSLSVKQHELEAAHAELATILEKVNPEKVTAIYGDSKIQLVTEYFSGEIPSGLAPGRGGTKLEPVFDELDKLDYDPACLVIFTDMEVAYPPDPQVPVLWLTTRKSYVTPPYGEVLSI